MERITISVDDQLLREIDQLLIRKGYANRSEAFRDILRRHLREDRLESGEATHCIACLSYVYNHHERELAQRLTRSQHDHHDLGLSTLHVHLDAHHCMEVVAAKGPATALKSMADRLIGARGVVSGSITAAALPGVHE